MCSNPENTMETGAVNILPNDVLFQGQRGIYCQFDHDKKYPVIKALYFSKNKVRDLEVTLLLSYTRLKAVEVAKDKNTRDHLAWTAGNGDLMHELSHTGYLALWEQQG